MLALELLSVCSNFVRACSGLMRAPPPSDMCTEKFLLISMGGQAEGLRCADLGARTPIGVSGNWSERSASAALGCCRQNVVASINVYFYFLSPPFSFSQKGLEMWLKLSEMARQLIEFFSQKMLPPPRNVRQKISTWLMGGRAEGPAYADIGTGLVAFPMIYQVNVGT